MFYMIPTVQVDPYITKCKHLLQAIVDRSNGELTVHFLAEECRTGRAYLFVNQNEMDVTDLVIITFEDRVGGVVARVIGYAGSTEEKWPDSLQALNQFCKNYGAVKIVFEGRLGWQKKLPVKLTSAVYEMEVV